ncbi:MAG TPA: MFS transporter [Thiolinea sp.]|nr:MFS transporter [Thiolinea sp.]
MIDTGTRAFWQATLALCIGSFMIFANVYITQPLLPMIAHHFSIGTIEAGWSFTITTLTLGIALLFYGPLSDALGRRRLMVWSMAGACVLTLLLSQVADFTSLVLLRALQGACLAGLPAIAIAYMGDEFSRKALSVAVGFYIAGNTLGGISGRLVGGFVGDWLGWQAAFLVMGMISVVIVILFARWLPPSQQFRPRSANPRLMLRDLGGHLSNPVLVVAYLVGGVNFMAFITQYSYITFVLADAPYQLSSRFLGLLFLTYLSGTLASSLSGRINAHLTPAVSILCGTVLIACGSALTLAGGLGMIITGFLVNSFGFFLAHSTLSGWVSRHAQQARASASSLYLVAYYLCGSFGGLVLEPFWQWQGWSGVVVGVWLLLGLTLAGGAYLLRWQRREQAADQARE